MSKPYELNAYPLLKEGDPIGWQDRNGTVHVETFKSMGPDGIEVGPRIDLVHRAHASLSAALDVVADIESR